MKHRHRKIRPACVGLLSLLFILAPLRTEAADAPRPPDVLIGYTEFSTNLPGGRQANVVTMRAHIVAADSEGRRSIGDDLIQRDGSWTQFAGWSPDGAQAVVGSGWESEENARWEEEHKTFRFDADGWLHDINLVDIKTGESLNLTAVERVSNYNGGLFFWPDDANRLGFTALIEGISHPFSMHRDGTRKIDLTEGSKGFAYGFNASPDGKRIAYHQDYQIYLADADGSHVVHVETGQPFNFVPQWSPDGKRVLFLAGEHYNCHPHTVAADGTGLRRIADRNGYRGIIAFLDVEDFHGGSSDVPVWSANGESILFTRQEGEQIELFRADLEGQSEQLTQSPPGSHNYHPTTSRDGEWLIYGSNQTGTRQLYLMHLATRTSRPLTDVAPGRGAMWPHWQPRR